MGTWQLGLERWLEQLSLEGGGCRGKWGMIWSFGVVLPFNKQEIKLLNSVCFRVCKLIDHDVKGKTTYLGYLT